jgi:hypothetical protein
MTEDQIPMDSAAPANMSRLAASPRGPSVNMRRPVLS